MNPVQGHDVVLYKHNDDGTDTPFAFDRDITFEIQQEFKEVTDYSSPYFRKFKPDIASWRVNCSGLVVLEDYSYLFLSTLQLARTPILIKFVIDNGTGGLVIYSGNAYISSLSINANYKDIASYSVSLQGTSAYSQSGTTVTPSGVIISGGTVLRKEHTCSADSTTTTVTGLIGASNVVGMARGTSVVDTIIYHVPGVLDPVPTGTEILINLITGVVTAPTDQPFINTEKLVFEYQ